MSTLAHLYLLLAALSTLVSSKHTPSPASPSAYNNCSGDYPLPLPGGAVSTPHFKPQISTNPDESSVGWEEWFILAQGYSTNGSDITYGYRWSMGDPGSADLSDTTFSVWAQLPNGTLYHRIVRDVFKYEENEGGGFTCSIANNNLTWDPMRGWWEVSVNAEGLVTETHVEVVEPGVPFEPNYKSVLGQLSNGFFSRMDVPRGHMTGYLALPSGLNITIDRGIGSLKHTWSHKPIADTLSAYVRGTVISGDTVATVNWYQAWDTSGKEIDSMQLLQPGNSPQSQAFSIQITNVPDILSVVTTPTPTSLPLTYSSNKLTPPMCGPGADLGNRDQKMTWNLTSALNLFHVVDPKGGVILYQRANVTGVVWANGTSHGTTNCPGFVEVYHRG